MRPFKPEVQLRNTVKAVRLTCEVAEGVGADGRPEPALWELAHALEDAAAARLVLDLAVARGVGMRLPR